jgi:lipoprotein-releasing system permease protein
MLRPQMEQAGWAHRREMVDNGAFADPRQGQAAKEDDGPDDPFKKWQHRESPAAPFDPAKEQRTGCIPGILLAGQRDHEGRDRFHLLPGDDVTITFPTTGNPPQITEKKFTIVDFYECKMSEYDSGYVFVPIQALQEMRGMLDGGVGRFNAMLIKLKPGVDNDAARDKLIESGEFPSPFYMIQTWQDRQGALLAAVNMETAILNVLLFMIIAVSGFGILAIFFMIVVEKTRDIGILKALGASGGGIMGVFLSYGITLGTVGSGVGMAIGLVIVRYINEIADLLGRLTGRPVFDPSIYYFYRIPTLTDPWTVAWIVSGAVGIAVLASILPALRAALLHPVEALRYE